MKSCLVEEFDRRWVRVGMLRMLFTNGAMHSVPDDCHPWDADCIVEQMMAEEWLNEQS